MDQTIEEGKQFFDEAQKELLIVTDLDKKFFSNPQIVEHLESAVARGVEIHMIYDPRVNLEKNETPAIKKMIDGEEIKAKVAKGNLGGHYWVGDRNSVRYDLHQFQDFNAKGTVVHDTLKLATRLTNHFMATWHDL
jgi:sugar-specific transcriptional regulator TrmB